MFSSTSQYLHHAKLNICANWLVAAENHGYSLHWMYAFYYFQVHFKSAFPWTASNSLQSSYTQFNVHRQPKQLYNPFMMVIHHSEGFSVCYISPRYRTASSISNVG